MRALSLRTKRPECSCCLQDIFPEVARSLDEGGRVRHGRVVHVRLGDVRRTTVRLAGLWIGFKSSSLTPLAMLVRARSSVSVMVLKREVVRPASSYRSRPVTFVYVSR